MVPWAGINFHPQLLIHLFTHSINISRARGYTVKPWDTVMIESQALFRSSSSVVQRALVIKEDTSKEARRHNGNWSRRCSLKLSEVSEWLLPQLLKGRAWVLHILCLSMGTWYREGT